MTDERDRDLEALLAGHRKGDDSGEVSHVALQWVWDIHLDGTSQTLVKGMLGLGRCSLIYGDTGTGKSFFVLD